MTLDKLTREATPELTLRYSDTFVQRFGQGADAVAVLVRFTPGPELRVALCG